MFKSKTLFIKLIIIMHPFKTDNILTENYVFAEIHQTEKSGETLHFRNRLTENKMSCCLTTLRNKERKM